MPRLDPHSYADAEQARTRSFDLTATVDFEARVLRGEVTLELTAPARGEIAYFLKTESGTSTFVFTVFVVMTMLPFPAFAIVTRYGAIRPSTFR